MSRAWSLTSLLLVSLHTPLEAQSFSTTAAPEAGPIAIRPVQRTEQPGEPHDVRWWEAAAVLGGTLGVMAADEHISLEMGEHRTRSAEDVASVFRRVGQPEVYATIPLAMVATGLLTKDAQVTRAGGRLAATVALSTAAFSVVKLLSGRARPEVGGGAYEFRPFSGGGAFPSGHSTVAFALATSLADDLHNTWAAVGLYAVATGTAWSRVYEQRHWASDVLFGAALGVTTSKLVSGRWRIFGWRMQGFLVEPTGAGVRVRIPIGRHTS
jgi:membrane-associated phospholipid phosphatase